jgi:putative ABC transport system permease protein
MFSDAIFRLKSLFRRNKVESELAEELHAHVERETEKLLNRGLSRDEAHRRARLSFGGFDKVNEECREARGIYLLETSLQDLRYAARTLQKKPGFTAVVVLTLALGIGASTAVFSIVNSVLLKPLPYPAAERIVFPWRLAPHGMQLGYDEIPWGRPEFLLLSKESKAFQFLGAFKSDSFNLTGSGEPVRLNGLRASAGFFPALGVEPILGRSFSAEEDTPGHEHVAVLSYSLWREQFGSDPAIVGRSVALNASTYTVVGVMPADFSFPRAEEMPGGFTFERDVRLWVPLALATGPVIPGESSELAVVGRMADGISVSQAQAEMNLMTKRMENFYGAKQAVGWFDSRVTPLAAQVTGDTRRPLLLIFSAVGIVLLIACSNIASLVLARSLARNREFTLRAALGAGRARVARQFLTESLLPSIIGGAVGVAFAEAGIHFVRLFGPANLPRLQEVTVDFRVLAFATACSILTGILFGLAPVIGMSQIDLAEALNQGGQRVSGSGAGAGIRKTLLVCEIALAFVLVIVAGLLTQSFFRLLSTDAGFRTDRVLTFELSLPELKYPDQQHIAVLYQRALHSLQSQPGIESAAIVETLPIGGATESTGIRIPDWTPPNSGVRRYANYTITSPGFFATVGAPILRGREFTESDTANSIPVTVINDAMAKKFWPGQNPIGKQVGPGSPQYPLATIVGIVADVKHLSLREEPGPEMYVPYTQKVWPSLLTMEVVLRTRLDVSAAVTSARNAIRAVDVDLPIANVRPLASLVEDSVAQPKFSMLLLGAFGAFALVLACVGIYGVVSYSVAQRTREIGVRVALGASRSNIFGMILGQGARLAGLGIAIGIIGALGVTRMMSSFLYEVHPADPATFAVVCVILLSVTALACYLPARRATRVDPLVALRHD